MSNVYVDTTTTGNTTTSTEYTCQKKGMQYTIIGENIKADFNFLLNTGSIATKLDEMLKELELAANNNLGFYFENGTKVQDVHLVYDEIKGDVQKLKNDLSTLHSAFMTDIDNVNAELEVNFGHWVGYKVDAGRTTTTTSNN